MKTEDLIANLGHDLAPLRRGQLRGALVGGLGAGLLTALSAFALFWGARPDLWQALADPFVTAKSLLPLTLGMLSVSVVWAIARPDGRGRWARATFCVPLLLALAVLAGLIWTPPAAWRAQALGHSIQTCLLSIPLLSVPLLVGFLAALRLGAPTRPGQAGAWAGLAAGGLGAAIYSLYCIEDSALFYGIWYTLAIGVVALTGAIAGHKILRW